MRYNNKFCSGSLKGCLVGLFLMSPTHALVPLKIALDWFLNPHHAPLIVGKERGIFAKHGIDLQWIPTGGTEEGARLLAVRHVDASLSSHPRHLFHVAKGLPLVRIATLIEQPLHVCVMKNAAEWKEKRIGFSGSGTGFSLLVIKTALAQQGLSLADVQIIPQRWGMSYALLRGHVDIAVDLSKTYDVAYLTPHLPKMRVLTYDDLGIPPFDELIVVIHWEDRLNPIWKNFLSALKESIDLVRKDPEGTMNLIQANHPELTLGQEKSVWHTLSQLFTPDPNHFDEKKYETLALFLEESGSLPGRLPHLQDYSCNVFDLNS